MKKSLVIVESPAKARTLGRILGSEYTVKASLGHVRDLPTSRMGVDVNDRVTPEYLVPFDRQELVAEVRKMAREAPATFLATDPDREGEAISWHLARAAEVPSERLRRVVFHEITRDAVLHAFESPRGIDMDLVNAQQARRILDRLVGYNLSPLISKKLRWRGLSAGRVQSVALRLVVEREAEIEAFRPQEYWSIEAALRRTEEKAAKGKVGVFVAALAGIVGRKGRLTVASGDEAGGITSDLDGATWSVGEVKKRPTKHRPAPPFITSTLQQEAWRKLRYGAKRTMSVAQQLYEGVSLGQGGPEGLITYMRTDSTNVAASAVQEARAYIREAYGPQYVPAQPRTHRTRAKAAQEAHEAIRPTSAMREPGKIKRHLTAEQHRLYELVWRRFVASQMPDALGESTSVQVHAASARSDTVYRFQASGSVVTFPGFRRLYQESTDAPDGDKAEPTLPPLSVGDGLDCLGMDSAQHFTQPPPRYSEASLVGALEEKGVGRPSTYAAIVSTVQQRGYVKREKGRLHPLPLGRVVNDLLTQYFASVVDLDFTAQMEDQLDEIARGQRDWQVVLRGFYEPFASNLDDAKERIPTTSIQTGEECDVCGRPMVLKRNRWGRSFLSCSGYPECRNARDLDAPAEPTPASDTSTDEQCDVCGQPMVLKRNRWGNTFLSCSAYPTCRNARPLQPKVPGVCPECGSGLTERRARKGRRNVFYGCANYPTCRFTVNQRPLAEPCPECGGLLVQKGKKDARCVVCVYEGPQTREVSVADAAA